MEIIGDYTEYFMCFIILFIMNNELLSLLMSFIAGVSTVVGSVFIFFKPKKVGETIVFSLSFSMGIMILVSLFDLIPSSLKGIISNYGFYFGVLIFILVFLLGYQSVRLIHDKISDNNGSLYKIGILSMISLILHNFPEGIAVFLGTLTNRTLGFKLCLSIMLHNIPEGILISMPLYYSGVGKKRVVLATLLSGLSEPLGALISYFLFRNFINGVFLSFVLTFVAGLMISLAINDVLNEIKDYNNFRYMFYGLFCSLIIFSITFFL